MRIGLTGSTGFIGQCLLREYSGEHEFVAFTRSPDRQGLVRNDSITYLGIGDPGEGPNSPEIFPIDVLESCDAAVNLGFARPGGFSTDCLDNYLSSIRTSEAFFDACRRANVRNIVHISTRSVYGNDYVRPYVEDEAIAPFSYYGAAKACVEAQASVYNANDLADIKVLRFAQIVGANETQGMVAINVGRAKAGKPLQIWGSGTEIAREYLYVRDATSAIMASLAKPQAKGVFNIGTGVMTTVEELVCQVADIFASQGREVPIERLLEKHVAPVSCCMDVQKAADVLGWKASWPLRRALEAICDDVDSLY